MKELKYLVIHCTATPAGRPVSSQEIRNWHTLPAPRGRGWRQVGYSDMIHLNGNLENLVPFDLDGVVDSWEITNGATGINSVSRHVVYVGGVRIANGLLVPEDTRTPAQIETLETYVRYRILRKPDILVAGHNQFAKKACPSFNVPEWLESIGVDESNIYRP